MGQVQFWSLPRISTPSGTTSLSWTQDVFGRGHWNWRSCFSDPSDGGDSYETSWRNHQYSELCLYAFWPQALRDSSSTPILLVKHVRLFVLILVLTKSGSMYWFSDLASTPKPLKSCRLWKISPSSRLGEVWTAIGLLLLMPDMKVWILTGHRFFA